jgi:hypothetical protein
MTSSRAEEIARAFAVAGEPPEGTIVEVLSKLYDFQPDNSAGAWRIQVDAKEIYHQSSGDQNVSLHWLIDVDKCTGRASMYAQG